MKKNLLALWPKLNRDERRWVFIYAVSAITPLNQDTGLVRFKSMLKRRIYSESEVKLLFLDAYELLKRSDYVVQYLQSTHNHLVELDSAEFSLNRKLKEHCHEEEPAETLA